MAKKRAARRVSRSVPTRTKSTKSTKSTKISKISKGTKRSKRTAGSNGTASSKRATSTRGAAKSRGARTRGASERGRLFAPLAGSEPRVIGGVRLDVVPAGAARVKRLVYPAGFHWERDMKPVTGTELCMHAHVGFLAHGEIHIEYPDGCIVELKAPQVVVIEPGHDGWVVGREPAVLIEIDFERETIERLGLPAAHRHE
ncbi:MAG: hypothetical protein AB7Q29_17120 [Vicinamibacterales bacterium]